jgi:hypothetical protein
MAEQFKFPDEEDQGKPLDKEDAFESDVDIDISGETDVEIEIEDDVPEEDRRAQPLKREVEDPSDEEIEGYTKGVQGRIKELTHARHDERRAKEALMREKQELERLTQQILDENKRLKEYVKTGETSYQEMLQSKAESELEMARRKYREAQEAYDTDAIIEAQEALTDAKMKIEAAKNFRPSTLQKSENAVQIQTSAQDVPQPDEKTLRWQAKNQWFGSAGYEEMTAFALGLHQKLVATGFDPRSDEYFEKIDSRIKSVFPEMYEEKETASRKSGEPSKKPATVVASATRSTGAKKSVKLSATQAALADKLGIPRKLYAEEFLKQEARNG